MFFMCTCIIWYRLVKKKWKKNCWSYILTLGHQQPLVPFQIYTGKQKNGEERNWLRGIDTFGITQTGRYKYKRLRTYSYCLFDLVQADLLDTTGFYPKQNKNTRFIIVAVEVRIGKKNSTTYNYNLYFRYFLTGYICPR